MSRIMIITSPEAYMPTTDTYIEKDLAINDEIDSLDYLPYHPYYQEGRTYRRFFRLLYIRYGGHLLP